MDRRPARRWPAVIGCILIACMILATVIALPAAVAPAGSAAGAPRRFAASNLEVAMLPPFWAPHRADERAAVDAAARATGRRPRPLFGTDRLGRDLFARCVLGGAISLGAGFAAASIAVLIGTTIGTIAGLCGGRADAILMRCVDVLYGLPTILLVVLLAVAVDGVIERADVAASGGAAPAWATAVRGHREVVNVLTLLVAIGAVGWLTLARVVRGEVMSLRARPFMEAARVIGVPPWRQFRTHLLPNMLGPVIVYGTLAVPAAILSESFLSFLGIGVREPLPSWGNLAADGLSELNVVRSRWWLLLWPCALIATTLLALNVLGEWLRVRLDPRR